MHLCIRSTKKDRLHKEGQIIVKKKRQQSLPIIQNQSVHVLLSATDVKLGSVCVPHHTSRQNDLQVANSTGLLRNRMGELKQTPPSNQNPSTSHGSANIHASSWHAEPALQHMGLV